MRVSFVLPYMLDAYCLPCHKKTPVELLAACDSTYAHGCRIDVCLRLFSLT